MLPLEQPAVKLIMPAVDYASNWRYTLDTGNIRGILFSGESP
jgi:hypothetical protein